MRSPDDTALLKEKVELFGVGTNVKVKLTDGQKMKGLISSIDDGGFALAPEPGNIGHRIDFDQVSELTLLAKKYAASGAPDAAEARRVIVALGTGKHVMVRTAEMKIHGQIMAVERDHFVILPDDQTNSVNIAYQDVQQVGKNLGILSTITLVVLVIAVVAIISWTR